ncbi:response regulator transcription factor [Pseudoduganella namucuonensis]|uniref:DNA-binding response regulator, OmpR family, contains REC and winged-helix (WHTH) domain n=1 Tax=Pseudoduganella namucuonensis TaxID=1035707 RepID=A0A1I7M6B6_9BURK|nr:response regulator transcription factor [Pseudoduganella namucuonensis]SFV17475.1 DNA-binding response regulator, OmpR family, contains REC and winged-helix (wHTH) domain [Pseudoduganella namucuonensis]
MRLLIIEDNPDIVANLYEFFEPKGYVLDSAGNGYTGLGLASQHDYDAVVLDVMLPGLNGVELCQRLRTELHDATPVLMLTARDTLSDKVAGFGAGADDYLVKPFSLVELEIRLRALVRRARGASGQSAPVLRVGELVFDTGAYTASRAGKPLALTRTGYVLLRCLMREAPRLVPRETLEQAVWGEDRPDSDALRTHLHALRQALDKPYPFAMLRTVPGIGYKLVASEDETA